MTKVNSVVKTNLDPQRREVTKNGVETKPVHGAVLPVGAAGQKLFIKCINSCTALLEKMLPGKGMINDVW